jgi:hypothetical protein
MADGRQVSISDALAMADKEMSGLRYDAALDILKQSATSAGHICDVIDLKIERSR